MEAKGIGFLLVLGLLPLAFGAPVEAQLALQGSFSGTFGWYTTDAGSGGAAEPSRPAETFSGTFFNDAEQGFLHHTAVVCQGERPYPGRRAHGHCLVTDPDGDTARLTWQCDGQGPCDGRAQWMDGAGKYAGITGTIVFSRYALRPTATGYSLWKGAWQLPAAAAIPTSQAEDQASPPPAVARRGS